MKKLQQNSKKSLDKLIDEERKIARDLMEKTFKEKRKIIFPTRYAYIKIE